jgi:diguanylate cyclase (GGDEF)-like protein/PAS domain S-box-containing protein
MAFEPHPLLARQLRRLGLSVDAAPSAPWRELLERVSRAYADNDQDHYLLEHSQELASREMAETYQALQNERDLLESRVAERTEALRLSEGRLANLVSLSADWIWEQDADLRFTYFSAGLQRRTGTAPSELIGHRRLEKGVFDVSVEAARHHLEAIAKREPFRDFVYGYRRPDGAPRYIRVSGEPVFDANGEFQGYRGVGSDETRATMAAQRVQQLASYDSLTGLPNRHTFIAELEHTLARARRNGETFALCFIDLDRFKAINDSLGHAAGDELLKALSSRLRTLLRESDVVARLGGDEFVVLLEGQADRQALTAVVGKMLAALSEPLVHDGRRLWITASCGIALFPADGDDAQTLLKNADAAMYLAKAEGKNNHHFYTEALAERAVRLFALESDLRQAIEREELVLHFQPKTDLVSGRMLGVEALVRWQHPERGLLLPGEFISMAEETGLIIPLGRWVLRAACRQIRAWRDAGLHVPRCSVNLSARQFSSESLLSDVVGSLADAGVEADLLEIEITESVLMSDAEHANSVLEQLHALGVHVAVDNFGTGYSSLACLKGFAAGTLKLDRSFVHGLPEDRDDRAITQAVIALSHSLGLQVVAEGVETPEQLAFLRGLGCDQAQGFLIDHPLPGAQLANRLPLRAALAQ